MKTHGGSGYIDPRFLDLGTSWRWVVSFTPWPLFFFFQWLFQPIQGPGLFFSSVIIFSQTVGHLEQVISPSQGCYLHTGQHKHRIDAYTHQTSMPWVECEPTIPGPDRFTPDKISPGTHWIGGWVGPKAGMEAVDKIIGPTGTRTLTPRPSSP
jgi:hypothetical protein